jgi:deoxyadenosine/deoxycytidine kinase
LGNRWGITPIEENYPENPYLVQFYENLSSSGYNQFSFKSEIFFLTEKVKQLKNGGKIIDPALSMDLLYAKTHHKMGWMDGYEFELYKDTLESLSIEKDIAYPDIHIIVRAGQEDLARRIVKRNRKYEMLILENCPEYLIGLSEAVDKWAGEKDDKTFKLILDTSATTTFSDVQSLAERVERHIAARFLDKFELPNFPASISQYKDCDFVPGIASDSARLRR